MDWICVITTRYLQHEPSCVKGFVRVNERTTEFVRGCITGPTVNPFKESLHLSVPTSECWVRRSEETSFQIWRAKQRKTKEDERKHNISF